MAILSKSESRFFGKKSEGPQNLTCAWELEGYLFKLISGKSSLAGLDSMMGNGARALF